MFLPSSQLDTMVLVRKQYLEGPPLLARIQTQTQNQTLLPLLILDVNHPPRFIQRRCSPGQRWILHVQQVELVS